MVRASLVLLAACASTPVPSAVRVDLPPPAFRLTDTVQPLAYDVTLDLTGLPHFTGSARLRVRIDAPTPVVWLHTEGLTVLSASVGDSPVRVVTDAGMLGVVPPSPFRRGVVEIGLTWQAHAEDEHERHGLLAGEGYAFTHLEPSGARRILPCFDEPRFKTPWRLTLHVRPDARAVSNMPARHDRVDGGRRTVVFAETPPLPTYLLAFAAGDLVEIAIPAAGGPPMRLYAPKSLQPRLPPALAAQPALLADLEAYLGSRHPFAKLDSFAAPSFGVSGMENPGLIVYSAMILKPTTDEDIRRAWLEVVAHELAHQWFGNLVTHAWWDDLWLNEGLATWLARKIVTARDPGAWELDSHEGRENALAGDDFHHARRIRQPIRDDDDIRAAFDPALSYDKAAVVLGMFERFVGEAQLRAGVRLHLARHAGRAVTGPEALAVIAEGAGHPELAPAIATFLDQPGMPAISVETRCDAGRARLTLRQEPFTIGAARPGETLWQVPVCVHADGVQRCVLMTAREQEVALDSCPAWVALDAHGDGYYRSSYQAAQLPPLFAGLPRLSRAARLAVLSDVTADITRGRLAAGDVLVALAGTRLAVTADHELLEALEPLLVEARLVARHAGREGKYRAWVRRELGPRARSLGWDGPEATRALVAHVAEAGDPDLVRDALARVPELLAGRGKIPAVDAAAMLRIFAATKADVAALLAALEHDGERDLRQELREALGHVDAATRPQVDKALSGFTPGAAFDVIAARALHPDTQSSAITFVAEVTSIRGNLTGILRWTCDPALRARLAELAALRWDAPNRRELARAMARADACIGALPRHRASFDRL